MILQLRCRTTLLALALCLLSTRAAAAAPAGAEPYRPPVAGAILVTHGDTISHLGDFAPMEVPGKAGMPKVRVSKVGFKYSYWGIFWLDLWTWGGEYCIYEGKDWAPIPPAVAAQLLGVQESDLGTPFNYKFPIGLLILIGIIALGVLGTIFAPKQTDPAEPLFNDPRYQQALELYAARMDKAVNPVPADGIVPAAAVPPVPPPEDPSVAAFDAGVQHLTAQGVDKEEAMRNLATMVTSLNKTRA